MFVPAHTIWLLSDSDVKARLDVSRTYLRSTRESAIGLEAVQREQSISKPKLRVQASKIIEVKKELASMGASTALSIHAPFTPIGKFDLASDSNETRRNTVSAVNKCIQLAEDIGARVVNTHLGGIIKISSERSFQDPAAKKIALGRVKDALIDVTDWIEGRNVQLAIENVPYPLEETPPYSPLVGIFPRDFLEVLKDVGSKNLGVTIDFSHLWITHKTMRRFAAFADSSCSAGKIGADSYHGLTSYEFGSIKSLANNPFKAFIKPLCERIIHIHIADSDGTYVPGTSRISEGKPLGEVDLDLHELVDSLRRIESCSPKGRITMMVVEPKEANFDKPLNTLRSLIKLQGLITRK